MLLKEEILEKIKERNTHLVAKTKIEQRVIVPWVRGRDVLFTSSSYEYGKKKKKKKIIKFLILNFL